MGTTPGDWRISEIHDNGLYMNDGAISITAHDENGECTGRVCLVDIQSKAKRGQGYKAKCPERDANARLLAAVKELREIAMSLVGIDWCIGYELTEDQLVELDRVRSEAAKLLDKIEG